MSMAGEFHFDSVKIQHEGGQAAAKPSICCHCCGQKATLFVTQVSAGGKLASKAFCVLHALKDGLFHPRSYDLLQGKQELHRTTEPTCACGMTQSLFKTKGRAGCAHCYTTFGALIKPALSKIQNGTAHAGKAPAKYAPRVDVRRRVTILKMAMERAIKNESYEAAAKCRDQIAELSKVSGK